MDKLKRLTGGKEKSKTPESGESSRASNLVDHVDDAHTTVRRLSYETPRPRMTPTTADMTQPRMPHIHRILSHPPTAWSHEATPSTSSEVPSGPPSTLFMPCMVLVVHGSMRMESASHISWLTQWRRMFSRRGLKMIGRTCRISKMKLYVELVELAEEKEECRIEAE